MIRAEKNKYRRAIEKCIYIDFLKTTGSLNIIITTILFFVKTKWQQFSLGYLTYIIKFNGNRKKEERMQKSVCDVGNKIKKWTNNPEYRVENYTYTFMTHLW